MADIVSSLFGVTPELYQQAQSAQADKMAADFAQMTPFQKASFGIGRGAYQLAGALGGEDPQLKLISARNAIARQINYGDPNSILQGVQQLSQAGDTVGAMQLAEVARRLESEQAQTFQRQAAGTASLAAANRERQQATPEKIQLARELAAQVAEPGTPEFNAAYTAQLTRLTTTERPEAMTPEMRNAAALASLKGAPGSPEYSAEYTAQLSRLTTKDKPANVKEVGVAEGTRKPVFIDVNTDQQFVYDTDASGKQIRKPYVGAVDRTTARISATSQNIQENEFSKQLGGEQAKRYAGAVGLRDNAIASINTFEALSKLDDAGLISGSFANGRVGATNLLNTLGLISPDMSEKLARSENYQKIAGDAILATLGGKLGAGFSNEDRKFIQSLVPQLENSPAARRQLIDYMLRKNRAIVGETTNLINYAEDKRTLNGFVPSIPLPGMPTTTAPAATGGWSIKPVK
jgi:hypothetical protein